MTSTIERKTVKVVVLGDIGRSPRMQYHALSLAENGLKVNIISYMETEPLREITEHPLITITKLYPFVMNNIPTFLRYVAKAVWVTLSLIFTLVITGRCDFLLCQNPPAIPTLPVCRLYCLIFRTKFIIDWHNYAYSIMAMSLSPENILVRIAKFIEMFFGQSADHNFCVTYSMKDDLLAHWNVENITVLYDRPPKIFHPLNVYEKHQWYLNMSMKYPEFGSPGREQLNTLTDTNTAFTKVTHIQVELRPDRPGLVFSSTSWTPDEDFGILLEALQYYETSYNINKNLPKLVCVITGKGPMKNKYLEEIEKKGFSHISIITPWLEAADYPKMVGSADLGISLHTSSSGLDLPMKVIDMFGAGLPVCAFDFLCLDELVEDGINSYTFHNSRELGTQLINWFTHFPNNDTQNRIADRMREELSKFRKTRWEDNWNLRVKKYFM